MNPMVEYEQSRLNGIDNGINRLRALTFTFGGREYLVHLFIVSGPTPLIISHKNLDNMSLNYQSHLKVVDRPEGGYCKKEEIKNYLLFLQFLQKGFCHQYRFEIFIATWAIPQLRSSCVSASKWSTATYLTLSEKRYGNLLSTERHVSSSEKGRESFFSPIVIPLSAISTSYFRCIWSFWCMESFYM